MMMPFEARKQLISRILETRKSPSDEAATVIEQSMWLWHQMAQQITPLIGETGFQALYGHAAHYTLPHCPGFSMLRTAARGDDFFQILREDLVAMEQGIAERCNTILITKFADLVSAMIGETLMDQILQSVWDTQLSQRDVKSFGDDY
ncbi:hypothetical protein RY831_16490 [Noviherbaspirillum sp. CPCC 100848]|uniref:Uncharacterized protein n=1 Tax=Noviherbaspirillum album TaxID=3080276 RepID=A0ABU6JC81_9BURK|nr:hypothetical protein [Noviherbaspirillum sp. CPCC 100848]MEC4720764.1 hypothetical protein [Noviherbaspirillum sp. CPCC 100848]